MSSRKFSTELTPDPALRRLVLLGGFIGAAAGLVIIVSLPVAAIWRAGLALLWVARALCDLRVVVRCQRRCRRIRLEADGALQIVGPAHCCVAATLRSGSILIGRLAWLRFEAVDGCRGVELLRQNPAQNEHWRRFRLIWRHLGAGP